MSRFEERRQRLIGLLNDANAEALLVTNFTNVTYLTGFTGDDSYLLVSPRETVIISDFRYVEQLAGECPDLRTQIRTTAVKMPDAVVEVIGSAKVGRLGIEADSLTISLYNYLTGQLPKIAVHPTTGLVEQLREIKDADEIAELRRAIACAEQSFDALRAKLHRDRTEKELADELDHHMRLLGAQRSSFPTIVAAGPRAALPHARPTADPIGNAELVLVDWGAVCGHYSSDLTRVLVTAKISPKLEQIYRLVLKAQRRAIDAVAPGKTGRQIDAVAREVIHSGGHGEHFGHGLGHGIGLDVHEGPRVAVTNDKPLKAGMVVTIEPGIYLPGWGGIRIEDDVLVTETGHEVLTHCPKELAEAVVEL
ncbi:MAG TPA: Xaa-Pro peptidase family protein [Pirellulales bacterium]|nr:Xaa-Pro peptidase family protein [Pirellulales bacterium]